MFEVIFCYWYVFIEVIIIIFEFIIRLNFIDLISLVIDFLMMIISWLIFDIFFCYLIVFYNYVYYQDNYVLFVFNLLSYFCLFISFLLLTKWDIDILANFYNLNYQYLILCIFIYINQNIFDQSYTKIIQILRILRHLLNNQ